MTQDYLSELVVQGFEADQPKLVSMLRDAINSGAKPKTLIALHKGNRGITYSCLVTTCNYFYKLHKEHRKTH